MNSLSWFIYLVDVAASAGDLFFFLAALCSVATGISIIGYAVMRNQVDIDKRRGREGETEEQNEQWLSTWKLVLGVSLPIALVSMLITVAVPTERTMYLILGSELGEEIVESEMGQKVKDLVNQQLEKYLQAENRNDDRRGNN